MSRERFIKDTQVVQEVLTSNKFDAEELVFKYLYANTLTLTNYKDADVFVILEPFNHISYSAYLRKVSRKMRENPELRYGQALMCELPTRLYDKFTDTRLDVFYTYDLEVIEGFLSAVKEELR